MAVKPVKLFDRNGRIIESNRLFVAAKQQWNRDKRPNLGIDFHSNLSGYGFKELLSAGRWIYSNIAPVANAIDLRAELTVGDAFQSQFYGQDKAWGKTAENWLYEWHKVCSVQGASYNFPTLLKLYLKSACVDGDVGVLLTETAEGYPQIQTIAAHRIGNPKDATSQWINGVLVDGSLRPLAYQITDGDTDVARVEAGDMHLFFLPRYPDQVRGVGNLASSIHDHDDLRKIVDFLKLGMLKSSSIIIHETNESGMQDVSNEFSSALPQSGETNETATVFTQSIDGGTVMTSRAGTGSKVEFPHDQRPSAEFQQMFDRIHRSALAAIGWPLEFYQPGSIGGASLRFQMELVQTSIRKQQAFAKRIASTIDSWAVAKAIKAGMLPPSNEWWMWDHQPPAAPTADKGWDAEIRRQNFLAGVLPFEEWCYQEGRWPEEVMQSNREHATAILADAKALADKYGVSIEYAANMLQQRGTSGVSISQSSSSAESVSL